jgi:hypothetical protein
MSWYEFHSTMRHDPKIEKLRRSLRLSRPAAIGHWALLCDWAAGNVRAFTGDLSAFTPEQVAEGADYSQDAAVAWVGSLIDAGLVSRDPSAPAMKPGETLDGHASIVGWLDFCGEPVRKRIERQTATDGSHAADDWLTNLLGTVSNIEKKKNPVFSLFLVYKYVKKNKDKNAVKEDIRWNKLNERQYPWIEKILKEGFDGELQEAAKAVLTVGEYYQKMGVNWDASTIHKRLSDYIDGNLR